MASRRHVKSLDDQRAPAANRQERSVTPMKFAQVSIAAMILLGANGEALARCKYQYNIFNPCDGCTVEQRAVITLGSACHTNWREEMPDVDMVSAPKKGKFTFSPSRMQSTYRPAPGATGDDYIEFVAPLKTSYGSMKVRFKYFFSIQ